jgi:hypothetical protein
MRSGRTPRSDAHALCTEPHQEPKKMMKKKTTTMATTPAVVVGVAVVIAAVSDLYQHQR